MKKEKREGAKERESERKERNTKKRRNARKGKKMKKKTKEENIDRHVKCGCVVESLLFKNMVAVSVPLS